MVLNVIPLPLSPPVCLYARISHGVSGRTHPLFPLFFFSHINLNNILAWPHLLDVVILRPVTIPNVFRKSRHIFSVFRPTWVLL